MRLEIDTPWRLVNGDCKTPETVVLPETINDPSVPTEVNKLVINELGRTVSFLVRYCGILVESIADLKVSCTAIDTPNRLVSGD